MNEIELLSVELAQIRDHNKQMDCLNQDLLKLSKDKSFKINKMVGILQRKESGSIIQNLKQDKDLSEYFKNLASHESLPQANRLVSSQDQLLSSEHSEKTSKFIPVASPSDFL